MKLHITNGDCAGEMLKSSSSIEGDVLCWRDLLHDGPVQALPYGEYVAKRVEYLSTLLREGKYVEPISTQKIELDFIERDQILSSLSAYDEIVLWFEHDLYDQLQLLEVCQRLCEKQKPLPDISLVSIDSHFEVPFFHGFGNLTIPMMERLFLQRKMLSQAQLQLGCELWDSFVAESPERLASFARDKIAGWPFMAQALSRFCSEFPDVNTGLTLTQTYLLLTLLKAPDELPTLEYSLKLAEQANALPEDVTAEQRYYEILMGPATFKRIFNHLQQLEAAPFMGDISVRYELNRLIHATVPYVRVMQSDGESIYSLTHAGAEAIQGLRQWQQDNKIDYWRGGVHLTNSSLWMWSEEERKLVLHDCCSNES